MRGEEDGGVGDSSGSVGRRSGAFSVTVSRIFEKSLMPRAEAVLMGPALMALTRICWGPSSLAR
jgi:CBS-domain-containing membrane protein